MSKKQKHQIIRERLLALGYHVRAMNGFALSIVRSESVSQAA